MSIQSVREQLEIEGGKFEGELYIKLIPEGGGAGRRIGPINGTQLAYNPGEAEVVTRTSRMRGTYGQNLNTDSQPGSPTIEVGFDDIGKEQLELQMRGTSSAISEAGGTLTDETIAVDAKGSWIDLGVRNLSPSGFSVTNLAKDTTYDYAADGSADYGPMDWAQGMMFVPEGSDIAVGNVYINGTHLAVSGYKIKANQLSQMRAEFILLARNRSDPNLTDWKFTIKQGNVSPSQTADFLTEDFISAVLSGPAETPTGHDSPFEIERLVMATS